MFTFGVGAHGKTSGAFYPARDPSLRATLLLAHGAGAPRTHPFMTGMATRLADRGIDVVTFNFLYAEEGKKMPDRVDLLEATWRAAIATVRARGGLPSARLFIGGKSMGGRIATRIAAAAPAEGLALEGVVLLGYPLHPPGKPDARRDEILCVDGPLLVVQGTRDAFGTAEEMNRVVGGLARARVHPVVGGEHSLNLPTRAGADAQEQALAAVATAIAGFMRSAARS